jgi:hypothetical protein
MATAGSGDSATAKTSGLSSALSGYLHDPKNEANVHFDETVVAIRDKFPKAGDHDGSHFPPNDLSTGTCLVLMEFKLPSRMVLAARISCSVFW